MIKELNLSIDESLNEQSEKFIKNISSEMHYKSELTSDTMAFDWLEIIELSCPYLDNIIRNPKLMLINEDDVVKIEKARKITVESVKDLSKHTHYIDKVDEVTNEIHPSKILVLRREETYNTYENRFIYTLITNLSRFLAQKEALLENFESKNDKMLEYASTTNNGNERINIELKVSAKELPQGKSENDLEKEINAIRERVKKIRYYLSSWVRSEFITSLEKAHVAFVIPPIRKTNLILKNPNFQYATKLWTFLQNYYTNDEKGSKNSLDTEGNDILKGILDVSFLMDYYVLDSISSSKKDQKEKLSKYAILMLNQQIEKIVAMLLKGGIKISDQDILNMVTNAIKNAKDTRLIGSTDVKNKFKSAIDEYLDKTKEYM